MNLTDLNIFKL